jgi:hypothetical protein
MGQSLPATVIIDSPGKALGIGGSKELSQSLRVCSKLRLRGQLVSTVGAAVRLLKPLLDAVVTKHMLALWEAKGSLVDALWVGKTKLVVADDAS